MTPLDASEVLKDATRGDVAIGAERDSEGNDALDSNGVRVMSTITVKGEAMKNMAMLHLRPFCSKVGLKGICSKNKNLLCRMLAYSKQMDSAHEIVGVAASRNANQKMAMQIRLLNA